MAMRIDWKGEGRVEKMWKRERGGDVGKFISWVGC